MRSYEGTKWKDGIVFYWSGEMNEPLLTVLMLLPTITITNQ